MIITPLFLLMVIWNEKKIYMFNIIINYLKIDVEEKNYYIISIPLLLYINYNPNQNSNTFFMFLSYHRKWQNEKLIIAPLFIFVYYGEINQQPDKERKCKIFLNLDFFLFLPLLIIINTYVKYYHAFLFYKYM
jgi:hypothetical protein